MVAASETLGREGQELKTPWIRTPLVYSKGLSNIAGCNIYLKLENLQPSGSFKSRGIGNFMREKLRKNLEHQKSNINVVGRKPVHFYISSGGNAGLGCVHAAATLECKATVVVPLSTTKFMIEKLRAAGAKDVIQEGASWAEANRYLVDVLMPEAEKRGEEAIYIHPFDHPDVWTGNSGIALELCDQLADAASHYNVARTESTSSPQKVIPDVVACSVGGGGLFCGIIQGLDQVGLSSTKVIAVETVGAESLHEAVNKKELVTLPAITSVATSLGARTVCSKAFEYGQRSSVSTVVLTDVEAVDACNKFVSDERLLVETACGVCVALCYEGRLKRIMPEIERHTNVVIVVCGGNNISYEILQEYVAKYRV